MTERFCPQQPLPVVNLSVTCFAVTAPLVGEPLAGRRVFGVWRFAPFGSAGVMFTSAAEVALGADRRKDRKMNLMPRPPLLGEVASSVSDDDGEVLHQKAPPSLKGAMGALYHITMGSAYSALGASGAFASSAFAAGSAGAAAGFGACFTTGLGGFGSSFSGKRMMCLGHFWAHMPQPLHLS